MNNLEEIKILLDNLYEVPTSFYSALALKNEKEMKLEVENNKKIFDIYNKCIEEVAKYVEKVSIPYNELSIAMLVEYLYHAEYLKHQIKNNRENFCNCGIYTLSGNGVCRHTSSFLYDVFKKIGIPIEMYTCKLLDNENKLTDSILGASTHVANVIEYDNNKYVFDLINYGIIAKFKSMSSSETLCRNREDSWFLEYKPTRLLMYEKVTLNDIKSRLLEYEECSKKESITYDEYIEVMKETYGKIFEHYGMMKKFKRRYNRIK